MSNVLFILFLSQSLYQNLETQHLNMIKKLYVQCWTKLIYTIIHSLYFHGYSVLLSLDSGYSHITCLDSGVLVELTQARSLSVRYALLSFCYCSKVNKTWSTCWFQEEGYMEQSLLQPRLWYHPGPTPTPSCLEGTLVKSAGPLSPARSCISLPIDL